MPTFQRNMLSPICRAEVIRLGSKGLYRIWGTKARRNTMSLSSGQKWQGWELEGLYRIWGPKCGRNMLSPTSGLMWQGWVLEGLYIWFEERRSREKELIREKNMGKDPD
jgi:hypothetical protein